MKKESWVIGIDEVGRGPVAGPLYVCAVAMLERDYKKMKWQKDGTALTDSKKMTAKAREQWHAEARAMEKRGALQISLSNKSARMIDKKGIAVCIRECIAECLAHLEVEPLSAKILLDGGLKAPAEYKNQQTIIKGDLKEKIISLASVVAKVERDHYMIALAKKHSAYNWHTNKGYGTSVHITAIQKWGQTPFHRKTFLSGLS